MIRRPPRSTPKPSSAASDVYKRQEQDELLNFVSACLGISPIYRWADPLACHAYNVMKPGGILPWHFDSCEFTLSFMIQKPEKGGIFEYCPNIREPGNEKLQEVKKVLDGER